MMSGERFDQLREHLDNVLALIDVAGHVEDPGALWRRDSLAYVVRLAFKECQAVDALLGRLRPDS
jgi:hypothetical protein